MVGILQENCGHLQVLIENLLHFQQAQARNAAFIHAPLRLDQVLAVVAATHKLAMQAKEIALEIETVPVSLRGDAEKLRIALDNLVSNAVKFSPRQGTIHLQLRRDADTATVDIQDTAQGFCLWKATKSLRHFIRGRRRH